jgi:hypothetical protein
MTSRAAFDSNHVGVSIVAFTATIGLVAGLLPMVEPSFA